MVNPNEDTEFNDALRAQGILPPRPPSRSPSPDIPHITHSDAVRAVAQTADASQLSTLLEADNLDSDDERMFESYRRQRIAELRKDEKRGRFGSLMPLGREDFVREVTEGSKETADGQTEDGNGDEEDDEGDETLRRPRRLRGTGVVVFLYKDAVPLAQHLRPLLSQLAAAHHSAKFLAIRSDLCIPNYPDRNVPTLLVYRNGDMVGNIVAGMGLYGMKTTVQDLEALLIRFQALEKPSSALKRSRTDDEDDFEDDFGNNVGTVNARQGGVRSSGGVGTGTGNPEDSDESDFDM